MKALIQRVSRATVSVSGDPVGEIGKGLLVLLGIEKGDDQRDIDYIADKVVNMRVFENTDGKLDLSVIDIKGEILLVSQFTLCADCGKGRRPDFGNAAPPPVAKEIYEKAVDRFGGFGLKVKTGRFQTYMEIELVNDGPVTIMLESPTKT